MLAADTSLPLLLIVASLDVTASDSPKTREDKRLSVLMCSAQVEAPTEQCEQIDCAPADQHDERNQNGDRHCGLDQVPAAPTAGSVVAAAMAGSWAGPAGPALAEQSDRQRRYGRQSWNASAWALSA